MSSLCACCTIIIPWPQRFCTKHWLLLSIPLQEAICYAVPHNVDQMGDVEWDEAVARAVRYITVAEDNFKRKIRR